MQGLAVAPVGAGVRHCLGLEAFAGEEIRAILDESLAMKRSPGIGSGLLAGTSAVLLFEKPSLRTRVSFEIGMAKLGGHAMYLDHNSVKIGERESVEDYAANLSQWCECIVARTNSHTTVEGLASSASVPVINALTDLYHPCQALADYLTLLEVFGSLDGLRLAYIGDGNNVCHSLMMCGAKLGVDVTVICPDSAAPDSEIVGRAAGLGAVSGASIVVSDDPGAVAAHDAVYTDTWVSMGSGMTSEEADAVFAAYRVSERVMDRAGSGAVFMHCLPATRGREVTASVIDGDRSVVLQQAANRMYAQNGLLVSLLGGAVPETGVALSA